MNHIIRYVRSMDGTRVAYTSFGAGEPVMVLPSLPLTHLERESLVDVRRAWYDKLATGHTVIRFDYRGSGLSDFDVVDVSLEAQSADIDAVCQDLGIPKISIFALTNACQVAVVYAEKHPEKVGGLILWNPVTRPQDQSSRSQSAAVMRLIREEWAYFAEISAREALGWQASLTARQEADYIRTCTSSETMLAYREAQNHRDISSCLAGVSAPTLILVREGADERIRDAGRYAARNIAGSRLAVVAGSSASPFEDEVSEILNLIEAFVKDGSSKEPGLAHTPSVPRKAQLSSREAQILSLIANGRHNRQIAEELNLSNATVERYLANLYAKLGVHNRAEATYHAVKLGLL